ncbi:MAG: hypothetical protein E7089_06710 [Bacteroidales bacterium]|nr:hypothetical protein [Bacteroidales bacterium]
MYMLKANAVTAPSDVVVRDLVPLPMEKCGNNPTVDVVGIIKVIINKKIDAGNHKVTPKSFF